MVIGDIIDMQFNPVFFGDLSKDERLSSSSLYGRESWVRVDDRDLNPTGSTENCSVHYAISAFIGNQCKLKLAFEGLQASCLVGGEPEAGSYHQSALTTDALSETSIAPDEVANQQLKPVSSRKGCHFVFRIELLIRIEK